MKWEELTFLDNNVEFYDQSLIKVGENLDN